MNRWPEVREVAKTAASSGEAELAEVDATSASFDDGELTAVGRPLQLERRDGC
jgi:hypothetical protein